MNRERSFHTLRHESRESSAGKSIIGRLFPTQAEEKPTKAINMNDSRRHLSRDPSRNFVRSKEEAQLFEKGVRKIQLELKQKVERSLPKRYSNQSHFNPNLSLCSEMGVDQKPQGLRKVKLQPKQQKQSCRRHIQSRTLNSNQDPSLNYVVPAINPSNRTNESKQVIIKIGGYRKSESGVQNKCSLNECPKQIVPRERKHFGGEENVKVKELLTDRVLKGSINFNHDFYNAERRIPKEKRVRQDPKLFENSKRGSVSSRLFR